MEPLFHLFWFSPFSGANLVVNLLCCDCLLVWIPSSNWRGEFEQYLLEICSNLPGGLRELFLGFFNKLALASDTVKKILIHNYIVHSNKDKRFYIHRTKDGNPSSLGPLPLSVFELFERSDWSLWESCSRPYHKLLGDVTGVDVLGNIGPFLQTYRGGCIESG